MNTVIPIKTIQKKILLHVITIDGENHYYWNDVTYNWNAVRSSDPKEKDREIINQLHDDIYCRFKNVSDNQARILKFGRSYINLEEVFSLSLGKTILDGEVP